MALSKRLLFSGQVNVTDKCDAGYYCTEGATSPTPSDPDQGGICPVGHYCPRGSPKPFKCDPGKYCGKEGLTEATLNCSEGYFCTLGANKSQPTDGKTGDICPAGAYCLPGSEAPQSCPPGTYSSSEGNTEPSDCINCTAGSYCEGHRNDKPDGVCDPGYYCPPGQSNRAPPLYQCDKGYKCSNGMKSPCPSGTYQDDTTQSDCKVSIQFMLLLCLLYFFSKMIQPLGSR